MMYLNSTRRSIRMRYWLIGIIALFLCFAIFFTMRNAPVKNAPVDNLQNSHKEAKVNNKKPVRNTDQEKMIARAHFKKLPNLNIISTPSNLEGNVLPNKLVSEKESPIIYLNPHPDDEVLTYGVDILNSLKSGRKVQIVLFSESISSNAFDVINGKDEQGHKVYDSYLHQFHNPIKEKYQFGYLNRAEFGAARVREYDQACLAFGLKPADIYFVNLENGFYPKEISHVINTYLKMYPNAEFRTMTKEDFHPEHAILGRMLQSFVDRHIIQPSKVQYLVSIYTDRYDKTVKHRLGNQAYLAFKKKERTEYLDSPTERKYLQLGIDVYKKWDPSHGWYAIGYHSVPCQFNSLAKGMYTKYYLDKTPNLK
jgi:LmbE family N-acetylglucosaminyl deacetylase